MRSKRDGGLWSEQATLIGFHLDTEAMAAQLPEEKIQQSRTLVLSMELAPGNYGVTAKTLHHLRGLCVHWLTCNLFWHCLCQPIDLLLSHTSESGLMV